MSKVYTSAVVIIPPEEIWAPIQEIRKTYDRNIDRWMPHITLLYPFRPVTKYSEIEKTFALECSKFKSFSISLKLFNYFHHGNQNYTIWIDPKPNDPIINLQANLLQIVSDCDDVNRFKGGYKPHLSLGQIKRKSKVVDILKELQENWKELKFLIKSIFFISRGESKSSKFEISKEIEF